MTLIDGLFLFVAFGCLLAGVMLVKKMELL